MGTHHFSSHALAQANRLMHFNWLVAADAHADWLGSWATLMSPPASVESRLLRRASAALLRERGLHERYLCAVDPQQAWLLLPPATLAPALRELGLAMLGGWVRNGLQRAQVAQQLRVLGAEGRAASMRYAARLTALPLVDWQSIWAAATLQPASLIEMGASCAAALLTDVHSGARERFLMRFPRAFASPMRLCTAQHSEAIGLMREQTLSLTSKQD